jgi:hypothetical protein
MQECVVCGLMYGGNSRCPGCGSLSADSVKTDSNSAVPTGPLPGIDALDEVLDDLEGWGASTIPGQTTHSAQVNQNSQLPFTYSTKAVKLAISLPFGFGSQGGLQTDIDPLSQAPIRADETTQTPVQSPSQIDAQSPDSALAEGEEHSTRDLSQKSTQDPTPEPAQELSQSDFSETAELIVLSARPIIKSKVQAVPENTPKSVPQSQAQSKPDTTEQNSYQTEVKSETEKPNGPLVQAAVQGDNASTKPQAATTDGAPTTTPATTAGSPAMFSPDTLNREVLYAVEDETVYHDFGDAFETSEVIVDFDELMDPAATGGAFDPDELSVAPDLMPARALPLNDVTEPTLRASVNAGFDALSQARWLDAADAFRVVCEARPGDAPALNDHGLALLQKALIDHAANPTLDAAEEPYFQAAILTLRQAALADRRNSTIMHNLATSLASAGRHETALPIFRAALTLDSDDIGTMNNLAATLVALGDTDSARSLLQRASEIDSNEEIIHGNLRRLSGL